MSNQPAKLWWGQPQNFNDRKNERKISWLELFYDLVYVAAISQLTHQIATHPAWQTMGYSFLIFCLVFWSWVNGSQYYDLHGGDSIRTRIYTFLQMLAIAAVAITIPDVFEGNQYGFAITFAIIQFLITYLWWSVGLYDPSHRVFNKFYTINYSIAFILLIISVFTNQQTSIILWIATLILNLTAPLIATQTVVTVLKERGQVFSASATIVERFGQFTIIVLTESILSTVGGVAELKNRHLDVWIVFILGILIAFLLWSLYFDMTSEQQTKKGYAYYQWLVFLHFPLLAGLSVLGACLRVCITSLASGISSETQWMFCISLATILLMINGITKIMEEDEDDRNYIRPVSRMLWLISIFILIIPMFGNYLTSFSFLALIAIILFIPVFIGIRSWVLFTFFSKG
jgi:low temperature requirement protein LtrA